MRLRKSVFFMSVALGSLIAVGCKSEGDAPADSDRSAPGTRGTEQALKASLAHFTEHAAVYGLAGASDLKLVTMFDDEKSMVHARFQQTIGGVPVFGGDGIAHVAPDGKVASVSDGFVRGIEVDTTPAFAADQAIEHAVRIQGCPKCLTAKPQADLWVLRHEGKSHLVWRVRLRIEDGTKRTSMPVTFIDAHDKSVVWQYDNLQTGTGNSLYSGTVTVDTTLNASTYYMEDLPRKLGTFDMTSGSTARFTDTDDVWDATAQRAGVDAHYGAMKTYDYWKIVHGRNGIDGNGGPGSMTAIDGVTRLITSRVHYGSNYNNAFWDGTQMTYGDGDGSRFSPLVTLDVAGHEMMHGVTEHTAGLIYQGESGALNESYSDVFGAMVERYARGDDPKVWWIGEECFTPANGLIDALRYMDNPHLVDRSPGYTTDDDPDHYSERYTGSADNGGVHINSGIANKTFFLLAAGGTHHRGGEMVGIGADKAAAIWYKALNTYMTSSTNFSRGARATYNAAVALYGDGSPEAQAVVNAWSLTGVPIDFAAPTTAVTAPAEGATIVTPTTITASAADDVGVTAVEFYVDGVLKGTDTTSPYEYAWNTVSAGNGPHTIHTKAYDAAGNAAQSAAVSVTVANETIPPETAITAPAEGATVANTVTVTATASDNIAVTKVEFYVDNVLKVTDTAAPYEYAWDTLGAGNGSHILAVKAYDAIPNVGTSQVTVTVHNPGQATYDATLKAPRCTAVGPVCDTGGMVDGRDGKGPEQNAPNTILASCVDGTGGTYHSDESLDRLRVLTSDGTDLQVGKTVTIEATVWNWGTGDNLDLYHTTTPDNPNWTLITTLVPGSTRGVRTLSTTFTLPEGGVQAIRGNFRYNGSVSACSTGSYDDRDDLIFSVASP